MRIYPAYINGDLKLQIFKLAEKKWIYKITKLWKKKPLLISCVMDRMQDAAALGFIDVMHEVEKRNRALTKTHK